MEKSRIEVAEAITVEFQAKYVPDDAQTMVMPVVPDLTRYNQLANPYGLFRITVHNMAYKKVEMRFRTWISVKQTETEDCGYYVVTRSWTWVPDGEDMESF